MHWRFLKVVVGVIVVLGYIAGAATLVLELVNMPSTLTVSLGVMVAILAAAGLLFAIPVFLKGTVRAAKEYLGRF